MDVLDEQMPQESVGQNPKEVFFWITMPEKINSTELLNIAVQKERVAFVPVHPSLQPVEVKIRCGLISPSQHLADKRRYFTPVKSYSNRNESLIVRNTDNHHPGCFNFLYAT